MIDGPLSYHESVTLTKSLFCNSFLRLLTCNVPRLLTTVRQATQSALYYTTYYVLRATLFESGLTSNCKSHTTLHVMLLPSHVKRYFRVSIESTVTVTNEKRQNGVTISQENTTKLCYQDIHPYSAHFGHGRRDCVGKGGPEDS